MDGRDWGSASCDVEANRSELDRYLCKDRHVLWTSEIGDPPHGLWTAEICDPSHWLWTGEIGK